MSVPNYFGPGMDGNRYSRSRPFIHATAIEKIRSLPSIAIPVPRALDAGCGTGQSTIALAEIGNSIIGIDPSAEMLAHALPHPNIQYLQSTAEDIPLASGQFGLITAAQAFHWFDQSSFLTEANRLLRIDGWLVIYNSWFTCEMKENSNFSSWFRGDYLARYPGPPRKPQSISEELAQSHGFAIGGKSEFTNDVSMTNERFTDYQLSTTNIIAAVGRGEDTFDNAAKWVRASIEPFFGNDVQRTFQFMGKLWGLEKSTKSNMRS